MSDAWRGLAAVLLLAAPAAARADERILHYLSDVQIEQDGTLEVVETIDVRAEHDLINHGIYRDFPTRYPGRHGSQYRVGFTFEGATLDGQPVPASTQAIVNGVRIKVGDANKLVDVGEHSYVLRYRTTRQIGRFKDFDELYWNATGNGWIFPIDEAEARIRLPATVKFGQRSVYTGPQGSTASNADVADEALGEILFRTTQALGPYEGLTVAAAFPKGVVAEPSQSNQAAWWLADYGPPLLGLLVLVGLCGFYYVAWRRAGRNPRAGTIVPIFTPPDNLSPAGMRYIKEMGFDNRTFAAALVDMGVKGHVRLVEENEGWLAGRKTRIDRLASTKPLSPEEDAALGELCSEGDSILMVQKNYKEFMAAQSALKRVLASEFDGKMFKRNIGWAVTGVLLFFGGLCLTAAAVVATIDGAEIWKLGVVLGCVAVAAILWLAFDKTSGSKFLLNLVRYASLVIVWSVSMPILIEGLNAGWWQPILLPALALPLVISAFWWIAAPTRDGRKILDHIAGFKQYLSITERERLDRMTPPEETPALFERYLPFAIALAVENHWAKRFAGVLAAASARGQQGFAWYSGSSSPWSNPGSFVDSVGSSLSSGLGSASAAPGSSGGGSSGGGGGGGGGGGW